MAGQYVLFQERTRHENAGSNDLENQNTPYGIPIYELIDKVSKKRHSDEIDTSSGTQTQKKRKTQAVETQLLAEKYRPQQFFDLLGNDDANRQVLKWLHYWKSCVFGYQPVLNDETDLLGRPLRKLLMLNGPPGAGKTTAAHVIAKQAGFDVIEINASDERGASVVQDRIVSAIQSHQVFSKRPVAIVADEVEGASEHGFVRALTNLINEDAKALSLVGKKVVKTNKSKKKQPSLLLRPIIAICNDVWSPNLHTLRQHSEIIHFQKQSPPRLLRRLEQICLDERLKLNYKKLSSIAEQCDYDLRACLNALQFGSATAAATTTNTTSLGSNRDSLELTDWNTLVKMQFLHNQAASFQQLESCSEPDKLVTACFTAYPESTNIEDTLRTPAALGDFLALCDSRHSTNELKAFGAHAFGYFFRSPLIAIRSKGGNGLQNSKNFGRPPSYYEESKRTKSIVANVLKHCAGPLRVSASEKTALLDLLPFIIEVANPVARSALTEADKQRLHSVANVLKDLGMTLRTEKLESGEYVTCLDPPVELACVFGETPRAAAKYGNYISRSQIRDALGELKRKNHGLSAEQVANRTQPKSLAASAAAAGTGAVAPSKVPIDLSVFFGAAKPESATQLVRAVDQKARKVWVQYSEGFSNAVRKPIGWNELFGH